MKTQAQLAKRIPIPADPFINGGLASPHNGTMQSVLGLAPAPGVSRRIRTMDLGPFKATGHELFLLLLKQVFVKVKDERLDLYNQVKSAGCYAFRTQRGSSTIISNHAWGCAIDLYFGEEVTPRGSGQTEQGLLELYPYLHNAGLYWGAEFRVDDGMHFEASVTLLNYWKTNNMA